ncbi:MAG: MATE family efflux transporter [Clostridia bacterium]|nr:MATE family efflux transporter [Clostridia bacterium]
MNNRLESEKIPKLLMSLALPAICAQIITLVYSMADRIYVGRMDNGALAMAGIGLCSPIMSIISGITALFARGGAPLAAIALGERDHARAEKYIGNSFGLLAISSLFIMAAVLMFGEPLMRLFGASDQVLPYALDYIKTYVLGTVFIQFTVGMNAYITTQGFARIAMVTTVAGGLVNIALDPVFIFGLDMGVKGAALATVISQMVSFAWVMLFVFGKKNQLRVRMINLRPRWSILKRMLSLGITPCFFSASEGIMHICFNMQVLKYGGDLAVGAMTVMFSMFSFLLLPIEGVTQGSQPIISFNYGAKRIDRVRETIALGFKINTLIAVVGALLCVIFPEAVMSIFSDDPALVEMGAKIMPVYIFGTMGLGANSTCQQSYTAMGEGRFAFFFAFYRKVILLIPLLFILPAILPWGIYAVVLAESISDLVTTGTNVIVFRRFVRKKLA